MPTLVAVDTMTLVWGVRKQGTSEQRERARWLFDRLEGDHNQILIPTVAVSEYLTHVDRGNHLDVIEQLNKRFILAPFDVRCASLARTLGSKS
ncbi:MAG: hypothetical protein HC834_03755, partial [Rhodospirillales bacterium]|nr:hypothetical protein [Rhodospirillales bacterium]